MKLRIVLKPGLVAILAATIGVTASSVLADGMAGIYLFSVGSAGALALLYLTRTRLLFQRAGIIAIGISAWLFVAMLLRSAIEGSWDEGLSDLPKIIAVCVVLMLTICAGSMPDWLFRSTMTTVAISHGIILIYGLATGDATIRLLSDSQDVVRLAGAGLGTAAWAEVALGTIMAAALSQRLLVQCSVIPIAIYTILAADMRTTMVAAAGILLLLAFAAVLSVRNQTTRLMVWMSGSTLLIALAGAYSARMIAVISEVLLLNDRHRGLGSGFSGRFTNFSGGWNSFLDNILLGAGFSDPVVNYTHNGYLLTLAQMGIALSLLLFIVLLLALVGSLQHREITVLAVIVGLIFFYMGQPRNINFQLCPLVGLFACSRALWFEKRGSLARSPRVVHNGRALQ
jgi:hypothetical protein